MGKRGPRPYPTALKLLHGEAHQDRINKDEPKPRPAEMEEPPDASPEVLAVWRRMVHELEAMGLAFASDADALRCFCEAVVTHRKACDLLKQSPILVKSPNTGHLIRNPALQIQRDAAQVIRQFAQEFGLTPSARSTIRANDARGDDADGNPFSGTG